VRKIVLFSYAADLETDRPLCRKSKHYIAEEVAAGRVRMIDEWRAQMTQPRVHNAGNIVAAGTMREAWPTKHRSFLGKKDGEKVFLRITVRQMRTPHTPTGQ
jgi:hypothetical protein